MDLSSDSFWSSSRIVCGNLVVVRQWTGEFILHGLTKGLSLLVLTDGDGGDLLCWWFMLGHRTLIHNWGGEEWLRWSITFIYSIWSLQLQFTCSPVFEKLVQEEEEVEEQMCIQESIPQNWADLLSYTPPQHLPDLSLVTLGKSWRSDCCRQ